jgi:hypothetical protein
LMGIGLQAAFLGLTNVQEKCCKFGHKREIRLFEIGSLNRFSGWEGHAGSCRLPGNGAAAWHGCRREFE